MGAQGIESKGPRTLPESLLTLKWSQIIRDST